MTAPAQAPLIFLKVVADRRCQPAALLFDAGPGDAAALAPLFEGEALRTLAQGFQCLYPTATSPTLARMLGRAGFRPVPERELCNFHVRFDAASLPEEARWVGGDWCLAAPPTTAGSQAASKVLALQLVQLVAGDADNHEIEALLRRDPTLSYHLLRLVNSLGMAGAGLGGTRKVTSFSQALLILGRTQLRRWVNLMLFAAREGDPRSAMLLARVAVRGRAIELLARSAGLDRNTQEQGFMTGMFSLLGILFGMPLAEVLAPLSIGEAVHSALLNHDGELGVLLLALEQAERGEFERVAMHLAALQVSHDEFNQAIADACAFMLGAVRGGGSHV